MKKSNNDIDPIKVIITLVSIGILIFVIGLYAEYANKPVSEIPFWVFWLLH